MINTVYNPLPVKLSYNYCKSLIGKIYKILPLFEEQSPTLSFYLESILNELTGMYSLFVDIQDDPQIVSVICSLEFLNKNDFNVQQCKREVFKNINSIEKIMQRYFTNEGDTNG